MKRLVVASDLHCGHWAGLCPPGWWIGDREGTPRDLARAALQRELWDWYCRTLASLQPIDILVCNGDAIDGRGSRSGGAELITSDLRAQARIATECLRQANATTYRLTKGTPYHVGPDGEDFEDDIALALDARIGGHEWFDINGVVFDFKHKVGSSQVPHGRHTAIAREALWNTLWARKDWAPEARVIVRSHVHYHTFCGTADVLCITTPALQGPGSKYGVRQCSGIVDFGLLSFDIDDNGGFTWKAHLLDINSTRPEAERL